MEGFIHTNEQAPQFVFPDIESERGEIERYAESFNKEEGFAGNFIEKAKQASLTELSEEVWKELENTDSFDIKGWDDVEYHASHAGRDWKNLKDKIEEGKELDAPIIVHTDDRYHLISGNTRLMASRAGGIKPQVLIVNM